MDNTLEVFQYNYNFAHHFTSPGFSDSSTDDPFVLVVLNQPITDVPQFANLWSHAYMRVLVDGASNNVISLLQSDSSLPPADVLIGDLDSATEESIQHFMASGTHVIQISDQDTTDLQKALLLLHANLPDLARIVHPNRWLPHRSADGFPRTRRTSYTFPTPEAAPGPGADPAQARAPLVCVCYGAFGGRADQTMSCLNALHVHRSPRLRVVLMGERNVAELVAGATLLDVSALTPAPPRGEQDPPGLRARYCGYYPLRGPARVATRGLRWDLGGGEAVLQAVQAALLSADSQETGDEAPRVTVPATLLSEVAFGGLVSTSNEVVGVRGETRRLVLLATDTPVVWSAYLE